MMDEIEQKQRDKRDFWLGLVGCVLGNGFLMGLGILASWLIMQSEIQNPGTTVIPAQYNEIGGLLFTFLPWLLNIGAIILFLVLRRPRVVLGILAGYAVGFILSLLAGVVFMVICFMQGGSTIP